MQVVFSYAVPPNNSLEKAPFFRPPCRAMVLALSHHYRSPRPAERQQQIVTISHKMSNFVELPANESNVEPPIAPERFPDQGSCQRKLTEGDTPPPRLTPGPLPKQGRLRRAANGRPCGTGTRKPPGRVPRGRLGNDACYSDGAGIFHSASSNEAVLDSSEVFETVT